ncbi:MAG: hypothetical protein B7Y98_00915 [Sphingomonas sp. 32-62-10]|nr:MAG: hypothetical protein B7Z43_03675 [Sphingomonas sp. 12-62-6]OYX40635.1 MAG: hypothetical protein B7Y98_00915 [Sphingomonas sp. 32-62-10]
MMKGAQHRRSIGLAAAALMAGFASPALAQQDQQASELDAIIDTANDPEAALRLAREQNDSGDLVAAAATLERALITRPSTAVRLYYVATLCRLDDRARAQIELGQVNGGRIADAEWAGVVQACGTIERPIAKGPSNRGIFGQLALGLAYDTDALGALSVSFDFPGITGVSDDDAAFIAGGQIEGRAPVGQGYVYAGLAGETKNAFGSSGLDYQIGTARLGFGQQGSRIGFAAGGLVTHARLQGDPFVTEYGGQADLFVSTGRTGRIALRGVAVHQDYTGSFPFFSRDGERYDLALDYSATTRRGANWVIGAAFEEKTAVTTSLGYRGVRAYSAFREPIGQAGSYGLLSSTIRFVDFRDAMFVTDRQEIRTFTRGALGTPLFGSGFDIEAGLSHTRRDYNRSSFLRDYDSFGLDLQIVWNFGK